MGVVAVWRWTFLVFGFSELRFVLFRAVGDGGSFRLFKDL